MPLPGGVASGFQPGQNRPVTRPFGNAAGYGMELPPHQRVQGNPQLSIEQCIEAIRDIYEGAVSTSDFAPWQRVPYRGRRRCRLVTAVLQVPAASGNPAATAAGVALQTANSQFLPTPIPLLDPTAGGGPITGSVQLFTFKPEARSKELKVESWGVSVLNGPDTALQVGVTGGTAGGLPDPPNPGLSSHQVELHQPAEAIVTENKEITITARNLSLGFPGQETPLLVKLGVCWWEFPVDRYVDSRKQSVLRGGYGTTC